MFYKVNRLLSLFIVLMLFFVSTANAILMKTQHDTAKTPVYNIHDYHQVNLLFKQINPQQIWQNISVLTAFFPSRSAASIHGKLSALWLTQQIEEMIKNSGRQDISIKNIDAGKVKGWDDKLIDTQQPSIIVKIGNSTENGIVIGAHLDTIEPIPLSICKEQHLNCTREMLADKPGADDDGSGIVTVLELARVLITSQLHFKKPIYLIFYAAEEDGLLGSKQVVNHFNHSNIKIDAVMQLDMVGYTYQNNPTIWLLDNYTDKRLTSFVAELIKTYLNNPVKYTTTQYGSSDHVNWYDAEIPVVAPTEKMGFDGGNLYIHSSQDTIDKLSLNHITDYTKLAIAFAVELAEPLA